MTFIEMFKMELIRGAKKVIECHDLNIDLDNYKFRLIKMGKIETPDMSYIRLSDPGDVDRMLNDYTIGYLIASTEINEIANLFDFAFQLGMYNIFVDIDFKCIKMENPYVSFVKEIEPVEGEK